MARRSTCFDVSTGENFAKVPMRQLALGLVAVAPNTCRARRKQCYCCRIKVGFPSVLPHVCSQLLYGIFWPLREICSIRVASDFSMNEGRFRGLRRAPCCRSFGSGRTRSRRSGASPRLSDSRGLTSRAIGEGCCGRYRAKYIIDLKTAANVSLLAALARCRDDTRKGCAGSFWVPVLAFLGHEIV